MKTIRTGVGTAEIDVAPPLRGDPDCSGRATAADLPALYRLIATGQRSSCWRDDLDDDCALDAQDLNLLPRAIFSP